MRAILVLGVMLLAASAASAMPYDVAEKDIATLQGDLAAGRVTSQALVQAYLGRIREIDRSGSALLACCR